MTDTTTAPAPDLGVLFDHAMTNARTSGSMRTKAQAWSLALHQFMVAAGHRPMRVTFDADGQLATDDDVGSREIAYLELATALTTNACLSGFGTANDRAQLAVFTSTAQQLVIVPLLAILDLELLGD